MAVTVVGDRCSASFWLFMPDGKKKHHVWVWSCMGVQIVRPHRNSIIPREAPSSGFWDRREESTVRRPGP